ncbi:hypothetical protein AC249_AIPGENE27154, partial [Exaiptasia diaphana]
TTKIRKRINVSERERQFVVNCYKECNSKNWKDVVVYVKSRIVDTGLRERVVQLYMDAENDTLITRMKNIVKGAFKAEPDIKPKSKPFPEVETNDSLKMKYAQKRTISERRRDAIKSKVEQEFVSSSSQSSDNDDSDLELPQSSKKENSKKNRKNDAEKAHKAHKMMYIKAIETMNRVNSFLEKAQQRLGNKKSSPDP